MAGTKTNTQNDTKTRRTFFKVLIYIKNILHTYSYLANSALDLVVLVVETMHCDVVPLCTYQIYF